MKLKTYNAENSAKIRQGKASLNINIGAGCFTLSSSACKQLGFIKGDHVEIHQDEDKPKDWYISKTADSKKGFALRNQGRKGMLSFNNTATARELLASINKDTNVSMLIGAESIKSGGLKLFPIITSSAS